VAEDSSSYGTELGQHNNVSTLIIIILTGGEGSVIDDSIKEMREIVKERGWRCLNN